MDNKLKMLFDYQRFEKSKKLEKLISETEKRYTKELSDEDLRCVSAAGAADLGGADVCFDGHSHEVFGEKTKKKTTGVDCGGLINN